MEASGSPRSLLGRKIPIHEKAPIGWPLQSYTIVAPVQERSQRDC